MCVCVCVCVFVSPHPQRGLFVMNGIFPLNWTQQDIVDLASGVASPSHRDGAAGRDRSVAAIPAVISCPPCPCLVPDCGQHAVWQGVRDLISSLWPTNSPRLLLTLAEPANAAGVEVFQVFDVWWRQGQRQGRTNSYRHKQT